MANPLPKAKARYKLRLNSIEKIEELLQEIYFEADGTINEVTENINRIRNSVNNLNDEPMDGVAKYAKALNDFFVTRDKAIGRKLEIGKLMAEIYKTNGNVAKAIDNIDEKALDWDYMQKMLDSKESEAAPADVYDLKGPKH